MNVLNVKGNQSSIVAKDASKEGASNKSASNKPAASNKSDSTKSDSKKAETPVAVKQEQVAAKNKSTSKKQ